MRNVKGYEHFLKALCLSLSSLLSYTPPPGQKEWSFQLVMTTIMLQQHAQFAKSRQCTGFVLWLSQKQQQKCHGYPAIAFTCVGY